MAPPRGAQSQGGLPVQRMVFHEITAQAIQAAIDAPREIDRRLVDAQEARRILDRLYGYEVSPVLWKKVMPGLSAGRVQSVATRIVVSGNESASRSCPPATGISQGRSPPGTPSRSRSVRSWSSSTGRSWRPAGTSPATGGRSPTTSSCSTNPGPRRWSPISTDREATVSSVESKPYRRRPAPPFMTSTLQQEAGRKLRMSSAQAMRAAQSLYEKGFITYMRTDSTTLSETALRGRSRPRSGAATATVPSRRAAHLHQEGQERPGGARGDPTRRRRLQVARRGGGGRQPVRGPGLRADLEADRRLADDRRHRRDGDRAARGHRHVGDPGRVFSTSGTVITHPGFQKVYEESTDEQADDDRERRLPPLGEGDRPGHRRTGSRRSRDPAAGPLHRSVAGQAAGGARRRPAVHLRLDHGHHPGPGLRVEEGLGAGAVVHGLQRRRAARAALPGHGRLRVHRPDGGRPRLDRGGECRGDSVAGPVLLR